MHTLIAAEVPPHSHTLQGTPAAASGAASANNLLGTTSGNATIYNNGGQGSAAALNPASITPAGGSTPHENRTPYLVMNWCIALAGIFPSRN
jgi:microcystin-dependent protein